MNMIKWSQEAGKLHTITHHSICKNEFSLTDKQILSLKIWVTQGLCFRVTQAFFRIFKKSLV